MLDYLKRIACVAGVIVCTGLCVLITATIYSWTARVIISLPPPFSAGLCCYRRWHQHHASVQETSTATRHIGEYLSHLIVRNPFSHQGVPLHLLLLARHLVSRVPTDLDRHRWHSAQGASHQPSCGNPHRNPWHRCCAVFVYGHLVRCCVGSFWKHQREGGDSHRHGIQRWDKHHLWTCCLFAD